MSRGSTARDYDTEAAATRWMAQANCTDLDTRLFFPGQGESSREAKAVCEGCIVRAECLEYALVNREIFGVWGGKSERQRRRIRGERAHAHTVATTTPGDAA